MPISHGKTNPLYRYAKGMTPAKRKALEGMIWRSTKEGKASQARAKKRKGVIRAIQDKRNAQQYALTSQHPAVRSFSKTYGSLSTEDKRKVLKAAPGRLFDGEMGDHRKSARKKK